MSSMGSRFAVIITTKRTIRSVRIPHAGNLLRERVRLRIQANDIIQSICSVSMRSLVLLCLESHAGDALNVWKSIGK